jgi:hypothetical protein
LTDYIRTRFVPDIQPPRQFFFNPEQLIVLRDTVRRDGARSDLSALTATRDVGESHVSVSPDLWDTIAVQLLFFAISIASRVSVSVPIWFSLIRRIRHVPFDSLADACGVGDEEIVAYQLDPASESIGQFLPAFQSSSPMRLRETGWVRFTGQPECDPFIGGFVDAAFQNR